VPQKMANVLSPKEFEESSLVVETDGTQNSRLGQLIAKIQTSEILSLVLSKNVFTTQDDHLIMTSTLSGVLVHKNTLHVPQMDSISQDLERMVIGFTRNSEVLLAVMMKLSVTHCMEHSRNANMQV